MDFLFCFVLDWEYGEERKIKERKGRKEGDILYFSTSFGSWRELHVLLFFNFFWIGYPFRSVFRPKCNVSICKFELVLLSPVAELLHAYTGSDEVESVLSNSVREVESGMVEALPMLTKLITTKLLNYSSIHHSICMQNQQSTPHAHSSSILSPPSA